MTIFASRKRISFLFAAFGFVLITLYGGLSYLLLFPRIAEYLWLSSVSIWHIRLLLPIGLILLCLAFFRLANFKLKDTLRNLARNRWIKLSLTGVISLIVFLLIVFLLPLSIKVLMLNRTALLGKDFGTIELNVYQEGKLIKSQNLWDNCNGYFFATNLEDIPIFSLQYGFGKPKLAVPINKRIAIHLLWEVKGFGKVMLKADNEGKGYLLTQKEKLINLNLLYELAKSRLTWTSNIQSKYLAQGYKVSLDYMERIKRAREFLDKAERPKISPQDCSRFSELSLRESLFAGEMLELEVARETIEKRKEKKSFLFGFFSNHFQGFDAEAVDLMKEAGLNSTTVFMDWRGIEPQEGEYRFAEYTARWEIEFLKKMGFKINAHGILYFQDWCTPEYLKGIEFDRLKEKVYNHVYHTVKRFKEDVHIWILVNEPHAKGANILGLTHNEMREIIKIAVKAARNADPKAKILINSTEVGGFTLHFNYIPFVWLYNSQAGEYNIHPYKFLESLKGIEYDFVGLQFYYGGHTRDSGRKIGLPAIDLFTLSRILDKYSQLGKPIYVTEVSVPSTFDHSWRIGYWHRRWDEQTQAEWLEKFYTICLSKPYLNGVTWWDTNDRHSFITNGGLLDEDNKPKKSYEALKKIVTDKRLNN